MRAALFFAGLVGIVIVAACAPDRDLFSGDSGADGGQTGTGGDGGSSSVTSLGVGASGG